MKTIKILVASVTMIACVLFGVNAQNIDQKKMNRDIEIAEDILMSMMKQDKETLFDLAKEPKGMYVPDYGVIFNISGSASPFRVMEHWGNIGSTGGMNFDFNFSDSFVVDTDELERKAQILAIQAQKMALVHEKQTLETQQHMKEMEKEAEGLAEEAEELAREAENEAERAERRKKKKDEVEIDEKIEIEVQDDDDRTLHTRTIIVKSPNKNVKNINNQNVWPKSAMEVSEIDSANFRALMMDFLIDYSGLIGQLTPEQKIMVTSGTGGRRQFGRSYYSGKLTAEIKKKDLESYRTDKLTRDQLVEKIKINKSDDSKEVFKDLELFSTIMNRIYDHDLAETYYISRGINYEKLTNFGVIYSMTMYSSMENHGKYSLPTQNLFDLTFEERNKKVEVLYPQFEEELKRNILDYGKTIKSLNPNETILFQVKLTECKGCNMPESIEVSVKQSVLTDYDSDKLSKSGALAKVNIKKNTK